MQNKGLITLFSALSLLAIVLLSMPHLVEYLNFLAEYNWYNGLLAIIIIFSSVSLWVTYKYNSEESG